MNPIATEGFPADCNLLIVRQFRGAIVLVYRGNVGGTLDDLERGRRPRALHRGPLRLLDQMTGLIIPPSQDHSKYEKSGNNCGQNNHSFSWHSILLLQEYFVRT